MKQFIPPPRNIISFCIKRIDFTLFPPFVILRLSAPCKFEFKRLTDFSFLQALYKAWHVILAVSCIINSCNARLPQCLEKCDQCKNLADGYYDFESCQSYCFRGSPDPHCSKFLRDKIKRGPFENILNACRQYCLYCQVTYGIDYNGHKCLSVCEESGGMNRDLKCSKYWPWKWKGEKINKSTHYKQ